MDDSETEHPAWLWNLLLPAILFACALLLPEHILNSAGTYAFPALLLAAYILCGWPVAKEAAESILHRDFFNEFTLMTAASLVAICLGDITEAVGVMLFYRIGEEVQERAAGRSRNAIGALLASKPRTARLLQDGIIRDVPPADVPVDAVILVKPGDQIPLDGVVLTGEGSLDLSSLTGESVPAPIAPGAAVYSGSLCLDASLTVRTTALAADSMVGRILAMVEEAAAKKSRTERFITRFGRAYTRAVVAAAALIAVVPPLAFGQPWEVWIYRSLILLVVSCPCALFLSVPLAFFAGIGAAARQGTLVRGGEVFDALAQSKTVVFDKTGTLTLGKLRLAAALPAPGVEREELLRVAALAETGSSHPIAAAVLEAAGVDAAAHSGVAIRNIPGRGLVASAPEGEILAGNERLLRENGVAPANAANAETEQGGTAVHVALNGKFLGCLLFADSVKPGAAEALAALRAEGVASMHMLTGDREEAARAIAADLKLDGCRAGLLPDGKVAAFRDIAPDGMAVFVGDGVNDAPVLAAAAVGVAMGALGSGAAVEAADAVILDDSLGHLAGLFRIAARTRRIAAENIVFALGVKAAVMALGVFGIGGLWAAVFADVGVALLAVLNSLRLTLRHP